MDKWLDKKIMLSYREIYKIVSSTCGLVSNDDTVDVIAFDTIMQLYKRENNDVLPY